ncbi:MAG: ORF6N domain-containing protein [Planctomycetota bacterium]
MADLYGVPTKRLNEQAKRNHSRFPEDFMFRLTRREASVVNRSQIATGSRKHRDPRFRPFAFTEHGAIMAANVLNSPQAVAASVLVVRAFVRLRHLTESHREIAAKLQELEKRVGGHGAAIQEIVSAIRRLMDPPRERRRKRIGFHLKR